MAFGALLKPALAKFAPDTFLFRGAPRAGAGACLTFDDGPNDSHTLALLDVLEGEGATATFFMQGAHVEQHPAIVRQVHARGHELGNHNWSHRRPGELGVAAYLAEAIRTQKALQDCVGAAVPALFRPPYGTMTVRSVMGLAREGFRIVHWSIDSDDSFIHDAAALTAHVERQEIGDGDILLFHDDQAHTIAAMPGILRGLKARGLGFTSVAGLWPAQRPLAAPASR